MNKLISLWNTPHKRPYLVIVTLILSIFIISANIAWLNPDPDYVIKTREHIPVLWQYNGDAVVEFLSAAYFPEYYRVDKTRINRPGYPFVAKVLGEGYGFVVSPVHKLGPLEKGMLGYMTMKLIIYLTAAFALYNIVRRWFRSEVALLSVALVFLHPFSIVFSGTFHTSELQFITPILLVACWLNLRDNYSHKKNIGFSLLAGVLMLAKQNYAPYLAILLYTFFIAKKYKETILSFVSHLIPLGIWLLVLGYIGIPYYNHETGTYGYGTWILDLFFKNPIESVQILASHTREWLVAIIRYFTLCVPLALLAYSVPEIKSRITREHKIFFLILVGTNWLQFLATRSLAGYLTSDLAIIIFPLAAYLIWIVVERRGNKKLIPLFLVIYLVVGLATKVSFPWVHPFDQKGITNPDRVKLLEEGKLVPRI